MTDFQIRVITEEEKQTVEKSLLIHGIPINVFDFKISETAAFVERELNAQSRISLTNPKLILDIGANIGIWTFLMKALYPKCRFIAVEPLLPTLLHLTQGIVRNNITDVTVLPYAVLPESKAANGGIVSLQVDPTNFGSASLFKSQRTTLEWPCLTMTLNSLVEPFLEIDLLKMDIEGMEFEAFEGFRFWDRIKAVSIEIHDWYLYSHKPELQKKMNQEFRVMIKEKMGTKPVYLIGG